MWSPVYMASDCSCYQQNSIVAKMHMYSAAYMSPRDQQRSRPSPHSRSYYSFSITWRIGG